MITIVGVGALGSHVVQFLRNHTKEMKLIDFDHVESKNLMSQFHAKPTLGKNKTQALSQTMQYAFNYKGITVIPYRLAESNYKELLKGSSVVIDCLDNAESRKLVQKFARETQTPTIHGGLAQDGSFGAAIWDEEFEIDDSVPGASTCENGEFLPFIALVSSYISISCQDYLKNKIKKSYRIQPGKIFVTSGHNEK